MWRRRRDREDDLDRELQSHLDLVADEAEKNGLNPEEARFAARRVLGSPARVKEEVREVWAWNGLSIIAQDVRHACRTLLGSPGFAITAFLTLALGIGAGTAVFTLVDSVLLKPLAYRDSGRLVTLWERIPLMSTDPTGPNPRHADLWQKETRAFSGMALARQNAAGMTLGADHPRVVGLVMSTAGLFDVLQVTPALGRTWIPEDTTEGRDNVAILSYSLWQSLFHGDRGVIGRFVASARRGAKSSAFCPKIFISPTRMPFGHFMASSRSAAFRTRAYLFPWP